MYRYALEELYKWPVEVRAEINLKSKSLKMFKDKFNVEKSVRTAMTDYGEDDWIINL